MVLPELRRAEWAFRVAVFTRKPLACCAQPFTSPHHFCTWQIHFLLNRRNHLKVEREHSHRFGYYWRIDKEMFSGITIALRTLPCPWSIQCNHVPNQAMLRPSFCLTYRVFTTIFMSTALSICSKTSALLPPSVVGFAPSSLTAGSPSVSMAHFFQKSRSTTAPHRVHPSHPSFLPFTQVLYYTSQHHGDIGPSPRMWTMVPYWRQVPHTTQRTPSVKGQGP